MVVIFLFSKSNIILLYLREKKVRISCLRTEKSFICEKLEYLSYKDVLCYLVLKKFFEFRQFISAL